MSYILINIHDVCDYIAAANQRSCCCSRRVHVKLLMYNTLHIILVDLVTTATTTARTAEHLCILVVSRPVFCQRGRVPAGVKLCSKKWGTNSGGENMVPFGTEARHELSGRVRDAAENA